jgi:outer membrane protein TolC
MIRCIKILVVVSTFLASFSAVSQEKQAITLADVLKIGGASNLTIKEYNELQNLALAENKFAKNWWLPEIYAGGKTHNLWGIAMNTDGLFFDDLARENFWAGLGLNASWDIGGNIYKAKANSLRLEASSHLTQIKRNEVLLKSIETYYHSLQSQLEMAAYRELVKQSKIIIEQIKTRVDAGLTYQSDLLLAKSNYSYLKAEMLETSIGYTTSLSLLQKELNIPSTIELVCADTVLTKLELAITESSLEESYNNRPEIKYLELKMQSVQVEKKTYSTGLLFPVIQAGTSVGVYGKPVSPLSDQSVLNVGLMWRIPLREFGYGKIYQSKVALSQIKTEQAKNSITQEINSSKKALNQYGTILNLSKEAQDFSREALSQSIERQQLGTAKILEVFQMQQAYLKARLSYTKAVINFNIAQYKQYVAVGNNL